MMALQHPNIIQGLEVSGQQARSALLIMEQSSMGDHLNHLTMRDCVEDDDAGNTFQQNASVVGYCHSKGVAHRDIERENILAGEDDAVKIDFGFCCMFLVGQKFSSVCRTALYRHPPPIILSRNIPELVV